MRDQGIPNWQGLIAVSSANWLLGQGKGKLEAYLCRGKGSLSSKL